MDELGEKASSFTATTKVTDHQCSSTISDTPQDVDIDNEVPQRTNFFLDRIVNHLVN
jgi:hypothetical protein